MQNTNGNQQGLTFQNLTCQTLTRLSRLQVSEHDLPCVIFLPILPIDNSVRFADGEMETQAVDAEVILSQLSQHRCSICDDTFLSSGGLQAHQLIHLRPGSSNFLCHLCQKGYFLESQLKQHLRYHKMLSRGPQHTCSVCERKFYERKDLRAHLRAHVGIKPFRCNKCKKTFVSMNTLTRHVKTHDANRFACSKCGRHFASLSSVRLHNEMYHARRGSFSCRICGDKFETQLKIQTHFRIKHNVRRPKLPKSDDGNGN